MEAIHRVLVNVASSDWEEVAEDPPLVRYLGCRASRASQRNSTLGLQLCGGVAHRHGRSAGRDRWYPAR